MNQRFNKVQKMMVVSIVGRPNVGKSSLFNRLMHRQHKAITFDLPGVTRDRHYGVAQLEDYEGTTKYDYILVDTGGFFPEKVPLEGRYREEAFFNIMADQAKTAIKESDLVLFAVDVREGPSPFDEMIGKYLRAQNKRFLILANKWDSEAQSGLEYDFFRLGIEEDQLFRVSAAHGTGIQELNQRLVEEACLYNQQLASGEDEHVGLSLGVVPREEVVARVALVGAPNAGKSTLLNLLVGAERSLVSSIPGTTVDPIEGHFDLYFGPQSVELDAYKKGHKSNDQVWSEFEKLNVEANPEEVEEIEQESEEIFEAEEGSVDETLEMQDDEVEFDQEQEDQEIDASTEAVFTEADDTKVDDAPAGSFWRSVALVDTAGIRRQKAVDGQIETMAVYQSLRSMSEADIVILVVDANLGLSHQDRRLADLALEKGKSLIVVLNKVDTLKEKLKDSKAEREWIVDLRRNIPWLEFVQLVPLSALRGTRIKNLKEVLKHTILVRYREVPTGRLNQFVGKLVKAHPVILRHSRGVPMKVRYANQVRSSPPTFVFFCNKAQGVPDHYRRYLSNAIRREFELINTPVHLIFRTGKEE